MDHGLGRMMAGYVKFHRKMMEHPVFVHDGLFRLWTFCLFRANWKDATTMVPGTLQPITVRRGQFITGRDKLHVQLYGQEYKGDAKPASRTLWRWMETLESLNCISIQTLSNRCTLVTICNYETYQGEDIDTCPAHVQPVSSPRPADSTADSTAGVQPIVPPVSTIEEGKEGKKGRKKTPAVPLADCLKTCEQVHDEISPVWHQWITYKHERGDSFTQTGLKSAVTHIGNQIKAHGTPAVSAAILKAMASGWAGWDHTLDTAKHGTPIKPPAPKKYL